MGSGKRTGRFLIGNLMIYGWKPEDGLLGRQKQRTFATLYARDLGVGETWATPLGLAG